MFPRLIYWKPGVINFFTSFYYICIIDLPIRYAIKFTYGISSYLFYRLHERPKFFPEYNIGILWQILSTCFNCLYYSPGIHGMRIPFPIVQIACCHG